MANKDIESIDECIQEAERFIRLAKRFKSKTLDFDYGYSASHAACKRASLDLCKILARFRRRNSQDNYRREWQEVE